MRGRTDARGAAGPDAARRRATRTFWAVLAVLGVAAVLVVLGLLAAVASVRRGVCTPGAGMLADCLRLDPPALLVLGLAALGLLAAAIGGRSLLRALRAERRLLRALAPVAGPEHGPGVRVFAGREPVAFCAGLLRPRVYVSTGLVAALGAEQLAAVLAHEQHHRRTRDPLRLAVVQAGARALFFVPVLRPLHGAYATVAELGADEAAIAASNGRRGPLASALTAVTAPGDPAGPAVAPERVDQLMGRPPGRLVPGRAVLQGAISLVLLASGVACAQWLVRRGAVDVATLTTQLPLFAVLVGAIAYGCSRMTAWRIPPAPPSRNDAPPPARRGRRPSSERPFARHAGAA